MSTKKEETKKQQLPKDSEMQFASRDSEGKDFKREKSDKDAQSRKSQSQGSTQKQPGYVSGRDLSFNPIAGENKSLKGDRGYNRKKYSSDQTQDGHSVGQAGAQKNSRFNKAETEKDAAFHDGLKKR
jgi:hypothetical protein